MHLERLVDGSRRVTSITEVQRMESDVIALQPLFEFRVDSVNDRQPSSARCARPGLRPTFLDKFEKRDIKLPAGLFKAPNGHAAGQLTPVATRLASGR